MAHQEPSPSTVPSPMAVPKGVQVGVSSAIFFCVPNGAKWRRPTIELFSVSERVCPVSLRNEYQYTQFGARPDSSSYWRDPKIIAKESR